MRDESYRVGEWLVSAADNKLIRGERVLVVEPRLVDMLCYFSTHPGEVLSRDELIDNIWTRNVVTPHVVTQCISELRKCLKDGRPDAPEYIVTVPKRGYKLVASVTLCVGDAHVSGYEPPLASVPVEPTPEVSTAPVTPVEPVNPAASISSAPVSTTEQELYAAAKLACFVPPADTVTQGVVAPRFSWWKVLGIVLLLSLFAGGSAFLFRPVPDMSPVLMDPNAVSIQWVANPNSVCANTQGPISSVNELLAQALNNYSPYNAHDMTNYSGRSLPTAGKTLYTQFENQQHHRVSQCFLSVSLVNNATRKVLMSKRYIITETNLLTVQVDVLNHVFAVLGLQPPQTLITRLSNVAPQDGHVLRQYYHAHQLMQSGDVDSLVAARDILQTLLKDYPNFIYARAELLLNNMVLMTLQPSGDAEQQRSAIKDELARIVDAPELHGNPIVLQLQALFQLNNGNLAQAQMYAEQAVKLERNWLSYVLLGKVYELEGLFSDAADAYLSAYNQHPGKGTYYWIKNAIFQSELNAVAPYLNDTTFD
ncbi:lysine decarboxylation/transport transcriptional activator CadC [Plesiomonas shigelloides]|uniref:lysine decarboxylation/transport transcriptional activator CadC n=1 Tax=Plesiomonas shigelloides TaxID=703 RepID=UPI002FCA932B